MSVPLFTQAELAIRVGSILSGCIVVVVALLLHRQHRHKALLHFAAFMGIAVYIGAVSFLSGLGWRPPFAVALGVGVTAVPVVAGLCISLPLLVLSLLDLEPPRLVRWLVWLPVPALLVVMGIQIATYLNQGLAPLGRVTNAACALGFVWFFLEWIACCLLLGMQFRRITQRDVRWAILLMAGVMVAWIPFWIREVLGQQPLTSPYTFGLIWNSLSLLLAARHFFQPVAPQEPRPAHPGPLADGPTLDRFAQSRKLTPRERELCGLLVEGRTHADIAKRLFISEKTVRNHASNIYTKVGVSSRMELIQAIRAT